MIELASFWIQLLDNKDAMVTLLPQMLKSWFPLPPSSLSVYSQIDMCAIFKSFHMALLIYSLLTHLTNMASDEFGRNAGCAKITLNSHSVHKWTKVDNVWAYFTFSCDLQQIRSLALCCLFSEHIYIKTSWHMFRQFSYHSTPLDNVKHKWKNIVSRENKSPSTWCKFWVTLVSANALHIPHPCRQSASGHRH